MDFQPSSSSGGWISAIDKSWWMTADGFSAFLELRWMDFRHPQELVDDGGWIFSLLRAQVDGFPPSTRARGWRWMDFQPSSSSGGWISAIHKSWWMTVDGFSAFLELRWMDFRHR